MNRERELGLSIIFFCPKVEEEVPHVTPHIFIFFPIKEKKKKGFLSRTANVSRVRQIDGEAHR